MVKIKPRLRLITIVRPDGVNSVRSINDQGEVIKMETFSNNDQYIKIRTSMIQAAGIAIPVEQIESAPLNTTDLDIASNQKLDTTASTIQAAIPVEKIENAVITTGSVFTTDSEFPLFNTNNDWANFMQDDDFLSDLLQ